MPQLTQAETRHVQWAWISALLGFAVLEFQRWQRRKRLEAQWKGAEEARGHHVRVAVGSTSAIKIEAVRAALDDVFPHASVHGVPGLASGVAEQPVGLVETRRGAENRLAGAVDWILQTRPTPQSRRSRSADDEAAGAIPLLEFAVGIENGIMEIPSADATEDGSSESFWADFAVVTVQDVQSGQRSLALSSTVAVPTEYVEEAKRLGFERTTVGSLIAASGAGEGAIVSAVDPHLALTGRLVGRHRLLREAVRVAFGQMLAVQ